MHAWKTIQNQYLTLSKQNIFKSRNENSLFSKAIYYKYNNKMIYNVAKLIIAMHVTFLKEKIYTINEDNWYSHIYVWGDRIINPTITWGDYRYYAHSN